MVCICLYKDVPDIEGDTAFGIRSTASIIGVNSSNLVVISILGFILCNSMNSFNLVKNNIKYGIILVLSRLIVKFTYESFIERKTDKAYQTIWRFYYSTLIIYLFLSFYLSINQQNMFGSYLVKSFVSFMMLSDNFIKKHLIKLIVITFSSWFLTGLVIEKNHNNFGFIIWIINLIAKRINLKGKREYKNEITVAESYDDWTNDGIVEELWGEHIHLGYYPSDLLDGKSLKDKYDFKKAKEDIISVVFNWAIQQSNNQDRKFNHLLDAGCGIGGSSRYIFKNFNINKVTGISISQNQIDRAMQLNNNDNLSFIKMDATKTNFSNNTYDAIWSFEMEPHIEDKKNMINEFLRILKPGGILILGCWNSTEKEMKDTFLLDEWAHPKFWTIQQYKDVFSSHNLVKEYNSMDITKNTLPSWEESIKEGLRKPSILIKKPTRIFSMMREIVPITKMADAFDNNYMAFGVFVVTKK